MPAVRLVLGIEQGKVHPGLDGAHHDEQQRVRTLPIAEPPASQGDDAGQGNDRAQAGQRSASGDVGRHGSGVGAASP